MAWWQPVRRVLLFLLGLAVIIDALAAPDERLGELIIGLVMVGILPIEDLLDSMRAIARPVRRARRGPPT